MQKFIGYQCSLCGKTYNPDEVTYTCPVDGGNLDVILDYDQINKTGKFTEIISSQETSLWRYLPLLPVGNPGGEGTSLRLAGSTPLLLHSTWAKNWGLRNCGSRMKAATQALLSKIEPARWW